MGFFWKFTRSGAYSRTYVSLVLDVDPFCSDRSRHTWRTSFEELAMAMILLHDVEVMNQPTLGATKPAFKAVVQSLGYEPTLRYVQQRQRLGLVVGQCVMGRHNGIGLDWGRCASQKTPIEVDVSDFQVAAYIRASDGRLYGTEDKLSCYREHKDFCRQGEFYDLMPKHVVMNPIVTAMKAKDLPRAEKFVREWLKWT